MKFQIKHRFTGTILFELETKSLKLAVEAAAKSGANLEGANLCGANLEGASLYRASLYGASLYRANLYRANLYRANLYGANLEGANLKGANLCGANLYRASLKGARNIEKAKTAPNDHYFVSELLWRGAKKESEKDFAARVRIDTSQCSWGKWAKLAKAKKVYKWAYKILAHWPEYKERLNTLK